jgi:hypothetical protein
MLWKITKLIFLQNISYGTWLWISMDWLCYASLPHINFIQFCLIQLYKISIRNVNVKTSNGNVDNDQIEVSHL